MLLPLVSLTSVLASLVVSGWLALRMRVNSGAGVLAVCEGSNDDAVLSAGLVVVAVCNCAHLTVCV